ncbi:MAG: phosphotransferase [Chloroflexota bacterium]|nr:phosphotransferase [Chloroflexota bacterium]
MKPPTPEVPADAAAIDSAWLTRALRSSGVLTDGGVTDVQVEPLGGSQGFAGQLRRVRVNYDHERQGALGSAEDELGVDSRFRGNDGTNVARSLPPSFIVKLHSPIAITRGLIRRIGAASREIRFYRELAPRAGVPTAALHFAAQDGDRYVLLLEDLAPAQAGDPAAGCLPEQVQATVARVAGMHAAWWDSPALASLDWIPVFEELTATRHAICREAWPEFVERYRRHFPDLCHRVGPALIDGLNTVRHALSQAPPTLLHGDFRPDNVMYAAGGAGPPVAFVDWQVMLRGPGPMDVAYFLLSAADRGTRRALETDVLRDYRAALTHGGVTGYTAEQCHTDYRLAMADVLSRIVVLTTRVLPEGAAGWSVFDVLAERIAGAVVDLECLALIASLSDRSRPLA